MMKITAAVAEVLGLLYGDGCVFRYSDYHQSGITFTGSKSEFWYYRDFVKPTVEEFFWVHGRLTLRNDNTTRFTVYSKRLVDELLEIGIETGKKVDPKIPRIVTKSGLVVPFIRGLYHAEGSIYRRYAKQYRGHAKTYSNLLVIQIRMKLGKLTTQVWQELARLGIQVNRLVVSHSVWTFRITRQSMIRKFIELIQPRYKLLPTSTRL
ncbi:MAG: hypothetical protein JRM89_06450 [Nitrososphaerota archaeon]|nr:hypothetical protein [Nitrososphaerota archaeon]MDG7015617.1 hypothetical protein [Nitrososphaerota archaeon]